MQDKNIFFSKDAESSKLSLYKQLGVLEEKIKTKLSEELYSDFDSLIKIYEQIINLK